MSEPADEPAPSPPSPVRVEIAAAGHTVVIEAPERLETVAAKALEVWQATDDPRLDRAFGTLGFTVEQPSGPLPPELTLPARMTSEEPSDEQRRARRAR